MCHQLALQIYEATERFPSHERYGLTSQMRRAAYSAAANIAEGSCKKGCRELARFLDISLGSIGEMRYGLILARDLRYVTTAEYTVLEQLRNRAGTVTWKLYSAIRRKR